MRMSIPYVCMPRILDLGTRRPAKSPPAHRIFIASGLPRTYPRFSTDKGQYVERNGLGIIYYYPNASGRNLIRASTPPQKRQLRVAARIHTTTHASTLSGLPHLDRSRLRFENSASRSTCDSKGGTGYFGSQPPCCTGSHLGGSSIDRRGRCLP